MGVTDFGRRGYNHFVNVPITFLLLMVLVLVVISSPTEGSKKIGCDMRCSRSCEKLCHTAQFARCCIGLMTKRKTAYQPFRARQIARQRIWTDNKMEPDWSG
ncbi:hypothetical protein BV898_05024 [Hypsibius exemplaris]|uniref:Uncharacterized protein n=1 Tax=Hypsibius exemplaris TaxID=2072580 RepID=A0A1W0X0F8_HYPEX|nr:hypothetical protein BV898_05024 [Hypsibius exemplaris]